MKSLCSNAIPKNDFIQFYPILKRDLKLEIAWATLFVVLVLNLMTSFSTEALGKDIIRSSTRTRKRVAQAMSRLYMIVEGAGKISKILMNDPLWQRII